MPDLPGPSTNRRRLRTELRQLREEAGLAQAFVAEKLDWSVSKLTRVETGAVGISVTDVRALLGIYKAADQQVDQLVSLARRARERRWWDKYKHYLNPAYQEFIGFEADASHLRQYQGTIVPGLLQTEPYMREIMQALSPVPVPVATIDAMIEIRLKRHEEVLEGDDPTPFQVVLDEAALRRPVGGGKTMKAQLEHLAELQDHPSISIYVLPFAAGPHMGMMGSFHIMEFAAALDPTVLYFEHPKGQVLLRDDQPLIQQYGESLDRMAKISLDGRAAVDKIYEMAKDLA
jgi:transcriptional regulator with XRE-family HTH domain